ncbi:tetrathionate reductase family octaheme c-type cytochrome [Thiopseudomonas denitrificans]|uniref:tetrathionate reductase family octaheme c-type cytochrome n=1 Tax=Thiopseudomonas denitrificans TaxID=1501432 RepID=UPI000C75E271|nr:tetrathionate reductase family octaheme c-type cytochrome [Thiopseudomonas denitrificans]
MRTLIRICLLLLVAGSWSAAASTGLPVKPGSSTADHGKFAELQKDFASGPEVTRACLACHTEAAKQLQQTTHWKWEFNQPQTGQLLGKKHEPNVFCGSLKSNYPRCTSCHIGYGWEDKDFDFTAEQNVDCLACHDTTATYLKTEAGAGHPAYEDVLVNGEYKIENKRPVKKVDLGMVARNVGPTSRQNCGSCHFFGGGGDGVKHGDLDSSLINPDRALDVHMDAGGLNFSCATCHTSDEHSVAGSRYAMEAKDTHGIDIPGSSHGGRASCESCHGDKPHDFGVNNKLNDHTGKVACQTCHIPEFARGGVPTKMYWDWSQAGTKMKRDENGELVLNAKGKPVLYFEYDDNGWMTYANHKGEFRNAVNVPPVYRWFDGQVEYTMLDDEIDPEKRVSVNKVKGSHDDPDSRIWPFKRMTGKQPYDKQTSRLLATNVFGPDGDDALWTNFNWVKALMVGQADAVATGAAPDPFSGKHGFVDNEMFWPITHMVAPKEQALQCDSCHARDGRLAELKGFYMPGRDSSVWVDRLGTWAIWAALAGVLVHLLGRIIFGRKRS